MPGQEPPLKLFINLIKAALESLNFLQDYSDLPREYLLDLGERLFQYFDILEDNIRLQCNLHKMYKHKFKSRYIPEFSYQPRKILPLGYTIQSRDEYLCDCYILEIILLFIFFGVVVKNALVTSEQLLMG